MKKIYTELLQKLLQKLFWINPQEVSIKIQVISLSSKTVDLYPLQMFKVNQNVYGVCFCD